MAVFGQALYITDELNNRIRKVNTPGIISTFAGTGIGGFSGDGGPAISAVYMKATFTSGENLSRKGNISLIR